MRQGTKGEEWGGVDKDREGKSGGGKVGLGWKGDGHRKGRAE